MERKVQKVILLLVFFVFVLGGCKGEKKIEKHIDENKVIKEKSIVVLDTEIAEDIIKDYEKDIERYIVEDRKESYRDYVLNWKFYSIYFKNPLTKYFLLEKLKSEELIVDRVRSSQGISEKYQIFRKYRFSEGDEKNIKIANLYFPINKVNADNLPKIAFVVDDVVEDNFWTHELLNFPYTLNISIIPTRKTKDIAEKVSKRGWEVLMHLPMESISYPRDAKYLVSEAIMVGMDEVEIENIIKTHLERFGNVKISWVNNHMGSKVTQDSETMERVIKVFKKYNLAFLDSRTILNSVGYKMANRSGIPALENMLFIDHENDEERIKARFIQAVNIAKKRGWGVFILHLRPKTIKVLNELDKEGFFNDLDLVRISDLYEVISEHSSGLALKN
ncbi:divergent polysaccharide deacetylase family protein [Dictyoglomus thermophilum]|uniref:Divergent polysaccharide deacetylase family n=1 Tax=Dictyoglomus thermophilum (strain ATCC 35947 / DSM 3960 / H-6-12) TaxID=309799 RepID=B5YDA1_DICT6|nr:divergent polysaccharide deacetylase family protein [Dictyoglomus thermophilum]ACI18988.1 divergent polysaccharide deacetylase family [Dictyoglomus thermophilum H-6-12]